MSAAFDPLHQLVLPRLAGHVLEIQPAFRIIHEAHRDLREDTTNAYVAHWTGTSWGQDGTSLSNDPSKPIAAPVIAFSATTPYVAWRETTGGAFQIFVKLLNGST